MGETLRQWLQGAAVRVDPEDARHLAMDLLSLSPTQLFLRHDLALDTETQARLDAGLRRRLQGEPVAYITGRRGFWSMDLHVNDHTLIPRADTETLVEAAILAIANVTAPRVLDLGTGSGAIALAIAKERPDAAVIATDRSPPALDVAAGNAARLQLRNVSFMQGDWFDAVAASRSFDLIVSNPPYIRADDVHLTQGDLRFEPRDALVSGSDGLDAIRAITAQAGEFLKPSAHLMIEHGYDQSVAVQSLFTAHGFAEVLSIRDFGGNERVTVGQARAATIKG